MHAINRLSQRRETYVCMYISPGAVFPGVYARDAEETRIQLKCLFVPGHMYTVTIVDINLVAQVHVYPTPEPG